jgi:hypothetical protein
MIYRGVTQLEECHATNVEVGSSNLSIPAKYNMGVV